MFSYSHIHIKKCKGSVVTLKASASDFVAFFLCLKREGRFVVHVSVPVITLKKLNELFQIIYTYNVTGGHPFEEYSWFVNVVFLQTKAWTSRLGKICIYLFV